MITTDNLSPANYDRILATNSDIVGKKWWSSTTKVKFETYLAACLAHNPITTTLILAAMTFSYIEDLHYPIVMVPFNHPRHGAGYKTKVKSMITGATEIINERLANGETLYDIRESGDSTLVTKVGHILRKTSVDELPQLHNVNMPDSKLRLVGPRSYGINEFEFDIKPMIEHNHEVNKFITHLEDGLSFGVLGLASVFDRHAPLVRRFATENIYAERASWIGDVRILAGVLRLSRFANGV